MNSNSNIGPNLMFVGAFCLTFAFFWWLISPRGSEELAAANAASLAAPEVVGHLPDGREISRFTLCTSRARHYVYVVEGSPTTTAISYSGRHSETHVTVTKP